MTGCKVLGTVEKVQKTVIATSPLAGEAISLLYKSTS
jgi:hypothetical protein